MDCNCDLKTKLVGDGCEACNPKLAAELAAVAANVTKEGIEVKSGQVWRDLDKRMGNRQCRVVDVADGKARMQSIHSATVPATKVSIKRMHKNSTGWVLVQEAKE